MKLEGSPYTTYASRLTTEILIRVNKLKLKRTYYVALFIILISLGFFIFHQPILSGAGRFLAPTIGERVEVVILEGSQVVENGALDAGIMLLSIGRANRMVLVLHQPSREGQVFALQEKYAQFIVNELEQLGFEKEKIQIIFAPIDGHPITLTEARYVVARLSKDGIRSAIMLSKGFHTRRSFGAYHQ